MATNIVPLRFLFSVDPPISADLATNGVTLRIYADPEMSI